MNRWHRVGRWVVVIQDFRIGPILLGYFVHLEDGPIFRGPTPLIMTPMPWSLRRLLGWWRPTAARALSKGFKEAYAV